MQARFILVSDLTCFYLQYCIFPEMFSKHFLEQVQHTPQCVGHSTKISSLAICKIHPKAALFSLDFFLVQFIEEEKTKYQQRNMEHLLSRFSSKRVINIGMTQNQIRIFFLPVGSGFPKRVGQTLLQAQRSKLYCKIV